MALLPRRQPSSERCTASKLTGRFIILWKLPPAVVLLHFLVCRVKEFIYEVGAPRKQVVDCGKNDDQQRDLQHNTGFKPDIFHMPKV
jgi:hypothetical protein